MGVMGIKARVQWIAKGVLTIYPFFATFTVLMLVAEQDSISTPESLESALLLMAVYIHVVAMVMAALAMTLDQCTEHVAMFQALLSALLSFYVASPARYALALKIRALCRTTGAVAAYLTLAECASTKDSPWLSSAIPHLFSIFAAVCAYSVLGDSDLLAAVHGESTFGIFHIGIAGFLVCAVALLNQGSKRFAAAVLAGLVLTVNFLPDLHVDLWVQQQRGHFWSLVQIAADNVPALAALVLLSLSSQGPKGQTHPTPKEVIVGASPTVEPKKILINGEPPPPPPCP